MVSIFDFIIWLALQVGKMTQIPRCDLLPEPARWSHPAHSGLPAVSRNQNLPERRHSFLRFYGPQLRLGP